MKPEEVRQLRAWAVETALGKASMDKTLLDNGIHHDESCPRTITEIIADARKLVNFIRSDR